MGWQVSAVREGCLSIVDRANGVLSEGRIPIGQPVMAVDAPHFSIHRVAKANFEALEWGVEGFGKTRVALVQGQRGIEIVSGICQVPGKPVCRDAPDQGGVYCIRTHDVHLPLGRNVLHSTS